MRRSLVVQPRHDGHQPGSTTDHARHLRIAFDDLFGDAFKAISDTGFNIIQVTAQDDTRTVIDKLLTALDEPISFQPTFLAANTSAAVGGSS